MDLKLVMDLKRFNGLGLVEAFVQKVEEVSMVGYVLVW